MNQKELKIAVSRSTLGFVREEDAFQKLHDINRTIGTHLALEINPHRFATVSGFQELSTNFGIDIIGVHGPLQANPTDYLKDSLRNLRRPYPNIKEAALQLLWCAGFGALNEPRGFKRYKNSMELAKALNAYLVMHYEPLQAMGSTLVKKWAKEIQIVRENGWGPGDGRTDPLSWDPKTIKSYAASHGVGIVFDTSAAERVDQDILTAYSILQPDIIHFSDSRKSGDYVEENIIPGRGNYTETLKELLSEVKQRDGVIVVIEVHPGKSSLHTVHDTLEFIMKYR